MNKEAIMLKFNYESIYLLTLPTSFSLTLHSSFGKNQLAIKLRYPCYIYIPVLKLSDIKFTLFSFQFCNKSKHIVYH